jgi:hypothetical protein
MARVHVLKETTNDPAGDWQLWFQWCRYELDDGTKYGYRFIWRWPDGTLQAARGQARIPSLAAGRALMEKATAEGWGDRDGEAIKAAAGRLEARGYVVTLATGYVGWSNKDAAMKGNPSAAELEDARIIHEWS